MTRRTFAAAAIACWLTAATSGQSAESPDDASIRYVTLDAPHGTSRAVVVQGTALVHTRQLLPLNSEGTLVEDDSVDAQVEQVLDNLESVLDAAGSELNRLVRLHVYALSDTTVDRVREMLSKRLDPSVRPAMTAVLTPLPHRGALVAVDAVAATPAGDGEAVTLQRCDAVKGEDGAADFSVLPRGGVAYVSGYPAGGGLADSAVERSMSGLLAILAKLDLSPSQIVQLKVFLTPAASAGDVLRELEGFFPDQLIPPVVFVEWIASVPLEIELIAQLPPKEDSRETIAYYNPPEVMPSPIFSRAALIRTNRQIYVSGIWARDAADYEARGRDVFAQLQTILGETGSDLRHLAKATYYVTDDETSGVLNVLRPEFLDARRPPAASKATVHGVGRRGRTLTLDMIAVGAD